MKYWLLLLVLVSTLLLAGSVGLAHAATFQSSNDPNASVVVGSPTNDLHVFGSNVIVNSPVGGDLLAFGQTILVTTSAQDDEFLVGNNVTLQGTVGHDLRAAGNNITLSGTIKGNAYLAGTTVTIAKGAAINGDLFVAAETLNINGTINGVVHLYGGDATINGTTGTISGKVSSLTVTKSAVVNGNLTYQASSPASVASGSKIIGKTSYQKLASRSYSQSILVFLLVLIGKIILVGLLVTFWPKFWAKGVERFPQNFLANLGFGLLVTLVLPIIALILFVTIIGIPVALTGLLAWAGILVIGSTVAALFIGSWLINIFTKKDNYPIGWLSAALGIAAMGLVGLIPILGLIINFLLIILGVGTVAQMIRFDRKQSN